MFTCRANDPCSVLITATLTCHTDQDDSRGPNCNPPPSQVTVKLAALQCYGASADNTEPNRKNTFRIRSKMLFLTYMFNDLDQGPTAEEIKQKVADRKGKCTIAEEIAPTTGRRHMHVFAQHPDAFDFRNPRVFNVGIHHANVKAITRLRKEAWELITKGNNVLVEDVPCPRFWERSRNEIFATSIDRPTKGKDVLVEDVPCPKSRKRSRNEIFATAMDQPTKKGMLKYIKEHAPFDYYTSFSNIKACAADRYSKRARTE